MPFEMHDVKNKNKRSLKYKTPTQNTQSTKKRSKLHVMFYSLRKVNIMTVDLSLT